VGGSGTMCPLTNFGLVKIGVMREGKRDKLQSLAGSVRLEKG